MKWPSTVISWRILTLNFQSCHGGSVPERITVLLWVVCVCVCMCICLYVCTYVNSDHSKRQVLIMVGRSLELSFRNVKAFLKYHANKIIMTIFTRFFNALVASMCLQGWNFSFFCTVVLFICKVHHS